MRTCIALVEDGVIVECEEGHDERLLPTNKGVLVRRDGLEYDVVIINAGSADLSISPCLAELVADEVSRAEGTVTGGHSA